MSQPALSSALSVRRWAVIAAAGLSGVLVLVSMLADPIPSGDGRELIAAYAEHDVASGIHTNLIHYGFALIAPVVYAIVGMVRGPGAWLANLAGLLAVIGLSTLPGLVLLDLTSTATARAADVDTALAAQNELGALPAFLAIVVVAFPAAVLALPVAVTAMWRAGLVPAYVAVVAFVAAVAPNVGPWWIGFGIGMVWMLWLAYLLWRLPLGAWGSTPGVTGSERQVATATR